MDGFSLILGGALGMLAGWAFSSASIKQREANQRLNKASRAEQEISKKKGEAKSNKESSLAAQIEGFLFYALGLSLVLALGIILFSSMGG